MLGKTSQVQGAISASDEKVNCVTFQESLRIDEGDLAWGKLMLSATALDLSLPLQVFPALLDFFVPEFLVWILCHTITKSNLKLYV